MFSNDRRSTVKQMTLVPEIWHGTHNVFGVFVDCSVVSTDEIKAISKKHQLDGLIFLTVRSENEILMNFHNPDGTPDNCGNGLRVAARYCYTRGLVNSSGIIHSRGQVFTYLIKDKKVTVAFPRTQKIQQLWNIGGVVHKVIRVKSLEHAKEEAQRLRTRENVNITLVKKLHNAVFAQTFEQGVERFTASCGTGAIAAALETGVSSIFMPGGLLKVEQTPSTVFLTGGAERVT